MKLATAMSMIEKKCGDFEEALHGLHAEAIGDLMEGFDEAGQVAQVNSYIEGVQYERQQGTGEMLIPEAVHTYMTTGSRNPSGGDLYYDDKNPLAGLPINLSFQCSGGGRDYTLSVTIPDGDIQRVKEVVFYVGKNIPVAGWVAEQQARLPKIEKRSEPTQQKMSLEPRRVPVTDPADEGTDPLPEKDRIITAIKLVEDVSKAGKPYQKWMLYYETQEGDLLSQGSGAIVWDDFADSLRSVVPEEERPEEEIGKRLDVTPFRLIYDTPTGNNGRSYTRYLRCEKLS